MSDTASEFWEAIARDSEALGLSVAEAIQRARNGTLPRSYIALDLEMLVQLLGDDP